MLLRKDVLEELVEEKGIFFLAEGLSSALFGILDLSIITTSLHVSISQICYIDEISLEIVIMLLITSNVAKYFF